MKACLLLFCFCLSAAAQQTEVSKSLDRIANELFISNANRQRDQQQAGWDKFNASIRESSELIMQARLIEIQRQRAAREAAAAREASRLAVSAPAPAVDTPNSKIVARGRFQMATDGGVILRMDTETGQTWQFSRSTNGGVYWVEVVEYAEAVEKIIELRTTALNDWAHVTSSKDASYKSMEPDIITKAKALVEQRESQLGKLLTPDEMVGCAETVYQQLKTNRSSVTPSKPAD